MQPVACGSSGWCGNMSSWALLLLPLAALSAACLRLGAAEVRTELEPDLLPPGCTRPQLYTHVLLHEA